MNCDSNESLLTSFVFWFSIFVQISGCRTKSGAKYSRYSESGDVLLVTC